MMHVGTERRAAIAVEKRVAAGRGRSRACRSCASALSVSHRADRRAHEEPIFGPAGARIDAGVDRLAAVRRAFEFTDRKRCRDDRRADVLLGFEAQARLREREIVEPDVRALVAVGREIVEALTR